MFCLNKKHPQIKKMIERLGETQALYWFNVNKGNPLTDEDMDEIVNTKKIKPGVEELFESNESLANAVYEALGFNNKVSSKVELKHKIAHVYDIIYNGKRIGNFELPLDLEGSSVLIGDVEIDEKYRGKGLGVETYKAAINLSNKPIISLLATDEANRVWESLVKQGLAEKTENGYKSVKPQITPQQKQQATFMFSEFLDVYLQDFEQVERILKEEKLIDKKCS